METFSHREIDFSPLSPITPVLWLLLLLCQTDLSLSHDKKWESISSVFQKVLHRSSIIPVQFLLYIEFHLNCYLDGLVYHLSHVHNHDHVSHLLGASAWGQKSKSNWLTNLRDEKKLKRPWCECGNCISVEVAQFALEGEAGILKQGKLLKHSCTFFNHLF